MKLFLISIVIYCSVAIASADDEKKECTPGHQYQQDCNTCTCTPKGIYICTLRACYDGPIYPDTVPAPTPAKSSDECTQGDTKMHECNFCKCTDHAGWVCTRRLCPQIPNVNTFKSKRSADEAHEEVTTMKNHFTEEEAKEPNFKCAANTTVTVDCNRCGCGPDGQLTWCTKKGCLKELHKPKRDLKAAEERLNRRGSILHPFTEEETKQPNFRCEADSSIKVDCKRCFCGSDGKSVGFCVETSCYNPNKPSPTRNPEEYAKLGKKGALLNPYTEAETKQPNFKCTPNDSLKVVVTEDQCKRCLCGDDGKSLPFCVDVTCYKQKSRH